MRTLLNLLYAFILTILLMWLIVKTSILLSNNTERSCDAYLVDTRVFKCLTGEQAKIFKR